MSYVFFGGMRGTAWVNTFQTTLFLVFGAAAVLVIGWGMGGFRAAAEALLASPQSYLLTRERFSPLDFFSYTFIPLSSIAFPHITIFCLTAERMAHFKKTVVFYPLCLLAIWLPCSFLGVMANRATQLPEIRAKLEARAALASPTLPATERAALRAKAAGDDVLSSLLLNHYAPAWLAGLLAAGIMAAVMATDSQILALSTMFTEDVFAHYEGKARFGEAAQVHDRPGLRDRADDRRLLRSRCGRPRASSRSRPSTPSRATPRSHRSSWRALFWRGSTKWGALASTLFVAAGVMGIALVERERAGAGAGPRDARSGRSRDTT